MSATNLIAELPVQRDENGYWLHPDLPEFDEGDAEKFKSWVTEQRLELSQVWLESEDESHPAYINIFDNGDPAVSAWEPKRPDGEGWFLLSIFDTDDGPVAWFARRVEGGAA